MPSRTVRDHQADAAAVRSAFGHLALGAAQRRRDEGFDTAQQGTAEHADAVNRAHTTQPETSAIRTGLLNRLGSWVPGSFGLREGWGRHRLLRRPKSSSAA